jgi:hypothetical protein
MNCPQYTARYCTGYLYVPVQISTTGTSTTGSNKRSIGGWSRFHQTHGTRVPVIPYGIPVPYRYGCIHTGTYRYLYTVDIGMSETHNDIPTVFFVHSTSTSTSIRVPDRTRPGTSTRSSSSSLSTVLSTRERESGGTVLPVLALVPVLYK